MRIPRISFPAAFLFALLGCVIAGSLALPAAALEGSFQRTLQVSGNVNLDVETGSGNIQVRPGNSNEVQVFGKIKSSGWLDVGVEQKIKQLEANPPIQQNGNDIRVGQVEGPELLHRVSISYEVVVPVGTRLHARTGSGNGNVEGLHAAVDISSGSGEIKIHRVEDTVRAQTGSGGIEIDHVKGDVYTKAGSGSIRATDIAGGFEGSTGSGDLHVEQSSTGSMRAETGSGDLDLRGVRGSLEASSGSGSIHAEGAPTGEWKVRTGSGGVDLQLPSDAAFELNAHSSSGSISTNFPVVIEASNGKKELRGRVRGGGVSVEVSSGSGDIKIH